MIVAINKPSASFKAAADYLLNDKPARRSDPRPTTSKRVAWTDARNTRSNDPNSVILEMSHIAADAGYLKSAAGAARTGRPLLNPVKTLSLSWRPGTQPSRQEMLATADDFLAAMGWSEHQCLIVAHRDTAHPHIHLLINRVHPYTGMTLNDRYDFRRALRWSQSVAPPPPAPEQPSGRVWPRRWSPQRVLTPELRLAWHRRIIAAREERHARVVNSRIEAQKLHRTRPRPQHDDHPTQPACPTPRKAPFSLPAPLRQPRRYDDLRYPDRNPHPERAHLAGALAAEFRLLHAELARARSPQSALAAALLDQAYRARRAAMRAAFAAEDRDERTDRRNLMTAQRSDRRRAHPPARPPPAGNVPSHQLPHVSDDNARLGRNRPCHLADSAPILG